jgi:hypothetical protein
MALKDPTHYAWITYVWVIALAMLGGVVNFSRKVREGVTRRFNISEFIGEVVTSAFAGLITFWLCEWSEVHPLLTAALVGIAGHMGSRAIFKLEQLAERVADRRP